MLSLGAPFQFIQSVLEAGTLKQPLEQHQTVGGVCSDLSWQKLPMFDFRST